MAIEQSRRTTRRLAAVAGLAVLSLSLFGFGAHGAAAAADGSCTFTLPAGAAPGTTFVVTPGQTTDGTSCTVQITDGPDTAPAATGGNSTAGAAPVITVNGAHHECGGRMRRHGD